MREFVISSTRKTEQLHCVIWEPTTAPKAIVQIVHGMAEHIVRYDEFATFLTAHGYVVIGHDHLGHGKTARSELEYGFFARKDGHDIVIKDMYRIYKNVRKQYPEIPYILLGHSMGSYFARKYMTIYGNELNGVILSGTGNQPFVLSAAGYIVANILVLWKGDHYRSPFMHRMMIGTFAKSVKEKETDSDWLSKNKESVRDYINDSACGFNFTVGGNRDFMKILMELGQHKRFQKIPKNLPVLLVSGEKDPVGDMGKGVVAVYETLGDLGMTDVTMKLYEEYRHEILNELDRENVYEDLLKWISEKCNEL